LDGFIGVTAWPASAEPLVAIKMFLNIVAAAPPSSKIFAFVVDEEFELAQEASSRPVLLPSRTSDEAGSWAGARWAKSCWR
jgi:hypothetical protein